MSTNNEEDPDVNSIKWLTAMIPVASMAAAAAAAGPVNPADLGKDGYVDSNGVKIHYVMAGSGPLCVMIHGFPDFWYTWRAQMPELAKHFQVVAIDQRGYNLSDKPEGVDNYQVEKLVADIDAVVKHFKANKAIIVGHDWGGMVAWTYAMQHPDKMDRLVILNLPHPRGLLRELANNPDQQKASAVRPQLPKAGRGLQAASRHAGLLGQRSGGQDTYIEAFKRSSHGRHAQLLQGKLSAAALQAQSEFPKIKCPSR